MFFRRCGRRSPSHSAPMPAALPHLPRLERAGRGLLVLMLLAPLSACFNSSSRSIEAAETAVLEKLSDPGAAKFAYERVVHNQQTVVCGLVNTRQPSGKYVGWRRFYVLGEPRRAWIDIGWPSRHRAFKVTAGPPASVSYEYLWNFAGCRNSDGESGVALTASGLLSWFDG